MSKVICNLKEISKELGCTYHKISQVSGIRPTTIYKYRDNDYTYISQENLAPLLDALNIIAEENGIDKEYDMGDLFLYIT